MKKVLLLLVTSLAIATMASAQSQHVVLNSAVSQHHTRAMQQEMQMATNSRVAAVPVGDNLDIRYIRPAGAFSGTHLIKNNEIYGELTKPYMQVKPYASYTYHGIANGVSPEATYRWSYQLWNESMQTTGEYELNNSMDLTLKYGIEQVDVPMWIVNDQGQQYYYQMGEKAYFINPYSYETHRVGKVLSYPTFAMGYDYGYDDLLVSSKTFNPIEFQDVGILTEMYYSGCDPYGDNERGWWFGKNGGKNGYRFDGIAQAFEQPTHPYLLKQVVLESSIIQVVNPVEMTCRIYRLDGGIPAYQDNEAVTLPEEPGELVAYGKATVTPDNTSDNHNFIFFTLYNEEDGTPCDKGLSIDYPILVVVDGYNNPEMEGLVDFTAAISADYYTDEGYGELSYIKMVKTDDEGNIDGEYVWKGLNNFFGSGTMKTGLTIFLTIDQPYLAFKQDQEDGEYRFPVGGGVMEKEFVQDDGTQVTTRSIEFLSWYRSEDGDIYPHEKGEDELPEWLEIELTDGQNEAGEFNNTVTATVSAEPLPVGGGINYREATVVFEGKGCYINYTFKQGFNDNPTPLRGDVNGDGEVTIADVNLLIDIILTYRQTSETTINMTNPADVNMDGEVSIADVNEVINIILGNNA